MPNHVASVLELHGDSDQIQNLINKVEVKGEDGETTYNFDNLYPVPEELTRVSSPVKIISEEEFARKTAEVDERNKKFPGMSFGYPITEAQNRELLDKYGSNNWYDWRLKHHGTKWGLYNVIRTSDATFHYNTAWSPAREFFLHVSKDFPDVKFVTRFADEGGGFVGSETYKNGKVEESTDYDWDSEGGITIRQEVGYYYDEDEEEVEEE